MRNRAARDANQLCNRELTLEHGSVIFNLEAIRLLLNEDVTIVVTHKRMRLGFESGA